MRGIMKRGRNIPLHEHQKPKEQKVESENFHIEYMLAHILKKVEKSHNILNEIKEDVCTLNNMLISHLMSTTQW